MGRRRARRHDVANLYPARDERIGQQAPVALPPHRLRTHHSRSLIRTVRPSDELFEPFRKLRSLHVIRVAAEALVTPRVIAGVATRLAQTSERGEMAVCNAGCRERLLERFAREVRMAPRFRDRADV